MLDKIYTICGMPLSVCLEHTEVIKNLMILEIHVEQPIPPYDHVVHSFEARCALSDFHAFNMMNREGIVHSAPPTFYANAYGEDIPFYIDTYEVRHQHVDYIGSNTHDFVIPQIGEVIINGHFDSRDFEDLLGRRPRPIEKKKPKSIDSRFDILDL